MATEKAPTASEALKNLEQQLTCPVCLDRYTQPRTLPCLHSFCHNCLAHFPVQVQGGKHFMTCPMCRQTTQHPDKGVSGFQSAFHINNLLELHQVLEKVSGSQQNNCENCHKEQATGYCKQCSKFLCQTCVDKHNAWADFTSHQILGVEDVATTASKLVPLKEQPTMECSSHGNPLVVYCDTCDELICQLCTVKHHRDHECDALTDAFPRHQQQIVDSLQQVKKKLAAITTAIQAVETQERGFLEQVGAVRREIEATVQQLMQLLQESERQLMRELDQVTDAYVEKISARKKEADITIAQLKSCKDFTEEELRIGSQQEILVMKGQMVKRMAAVCSLVKEDNLRPLEETRVRFAKSASVLEACRSLGSILVGPVRCYQVKTVGNKISFDLCSAAPLSSEQVSCQLSPVADPTLVVRCVVHQVTPSSFEVRYPPPTAGLHQLRVQVGGTDILDTPLNVEVMPRRAGQTFDLSYPKGLAIMREGHLVVAESDKHCITIIDLIFYPTNGRKINSFGQYGSGQVQFKGPIGVAVTQDGRIVEVEHDNYRLQVLTAEGAFIATVGSKGSQPLQFKHPWDVAVDHNGKVFVTDNGNYRVQVLNADLTYSHCFGSKGAQPGEFGDLRSLAIDADGMVYVADRGNNRVQKFTPEGKLLAVIDSKGEGGGRLNAPFGLCVDDNDILYVTEYDSNTVSMFTSKGRFLGYIGDSDGSSFKHPQFIVSDQTGRLYISDKNRVVTY